jgi:hypothetical protein
MQVRSAIRHQLAKRAPALERRAVEAQWRRRNRERAAEFAPLTDDGVGRLLGDLQRDGIAIGRFEELFGSTELYEEAAASATARRARHEEAGDKQAESAKPYLTKLLDPSFELDDVFMRIALHPNVLAVANRYMEMRTVLRALDLWLTGPTPGPAIQTQLWHRDGDDFMNMKLFVLFTDVTIAAGPFCYAPRTHPLGSRRDLPERDDHGRSTDEQMARIVPDDEWIVAEGTPGTIVLADTCGYHKQIKPTGEQRLLMMSQYVSGAAHVERALTIASEGAGDLAVDQRYALYERPS